MKYEHDSETWTGSKPKRADRVSVSAWAVLITSASAWIILTFGATEAFAANLLSELIGLFAELAIVILAVDWAIDRRKKALHSTDITTARKRVTELGVTMALHAAKGLAFLIAMMSTNGAKHPQEIAATDIAASLRRAAHDADRLFDRHALAMKLDLPLQNTARMIADFCEQLARNVEIVEEARHRHWPVDSPHSFSDMTGRRLEQLSSSFDKVQKQIFETVPESEADHDIDLLRGIITAIQAFFRTGLQKPRTTPDSEPQAPPDQPED